MDPSRKNEEDDRLFGHMQHVLMYHETMLADAVRNRAFQRALKKRVKPGAEVLDIGSGTGIWAILAAKLGARRVVAVEKEPLLVPIIEKLVKLNGVGDRVRVLGGDSRQLKIKGKFDVIVSETIGNEAFDEEIVPIMIDARKRFLKKDGALIPLSIASVLCPAHYDTSVLTLPAGVKLKYQYLEALSLDIPKRLQDRRKLRFLGTPRVLTRVELDKVKEPPDLGNLLASWRLLDTSEINCLVLWAEVLLAPGVRLRTIDSSNWSPIIFPVEPFAAGPAQLECRFTMTQKQYYWTLTLSGRGRREIQSHSPVFPYTSLKAQLSTEKG